MSAPRISSGPVWPNVDLTVLVDHLKSYVLPDPAVNLGVGVYGYGGPLLSSQYLGIGAVLVVAGGVIAWRHDLRLWLFGGVAAVSAAFSLGAGESLFRRLPLFENIVPNRFDSMLFLAVAVMLGIILDHAYRATYRWRVKALAALDVGGAPRSRLGDPWILKPKSVAASAALIVAVVAIAPIAAYEAQGIPASTQHVSLPPWFRDVGSHLDTRTCQVLLTFPDVLSERSAETWQALDDLRYSIVDEGGPGGLPSRAGREAAGLLLLSIASLPTSVSGAYGITYVKMTPQKILEVRHAYAPGA